MKSEQEIRKAMEKLRMAIKVCKMQPDGDREELGMRAAYGILCWAVDGGNKEQTAVMHSTDALLACLERIYRRTGERN